jgi:hypothetical protein
MNLNQALFALNERYYMRDKQVFKTMAAFALIPKNHLRDINLILAHPGESAAELTRAVTAMTAVWQNVVVLSGIHYKPSFQL